MITCKITQNALVCVIDRENFYRRYVFPLRSVTRKEVQQIRLNENSGKKWFLFKEGPLLSLADISDLPSNTRVTLSFADSNSKHLCCDCSFQSALPDELGGCQKCRQFASMLELLDDILLAYETWGTGGADVLDVVKCSRYKEELIIPKQSNTNNNSANQSNTNPGSWRNMKVSKFLGDVLIG